MVVQRALRTAISRAARALRVRVHARAWLLAALTAVLTATAGGARAVPYGPFNRSSDDSGTYPVVLVTYSLACTQYSSQADVDLVKAFGQYVLSPEGQADAADSAKSAPLSEELSQRATDSIARPQSARPCATAAATALWLVAWMA